MHYWVFDVPADKLEKWTATSHHPDGLSVRSFNDVDCAAIQEEFGLAFNPISASFYDPTVVLTDDDITPPEFAEWVTYVERPNPLDHRFQIIQHLGNFTMRMHPNGVGRVVDVARNPSSWATITEQVLRRDNQYRFNFESSDVAHSRRIWEALNGLWIHHGLEGFGIYREDIQLSIAGGVNKLTEELRHAANERAARLVDLSAAVESELAAQVKLDTMRHHASDADLVRLATEAQGWPFLKELWLSINGFDLYTEVILIGKISCSLRIHYNSANNGGGLRLSVGNTRTVVANPDSERFRRIATMAARLEYSAPRRVREIQKELEDLVEGDFLCTRRMATATAGTGTASQ